MDGTKERPLKQLAVLGTTYGDVARHVIWGDKRERNVTDWIVTCNVTERLIRYVLKMNLDRSPMQPEKNLLLAETPTKWNNRFLDFLR